MNPGPDDFACLTCLDFGVLPEVGPCPIVSAGGVRRVRPGPRLPGPAAGRVLGGEAA